MTFKKVKRTERGWKAHFIGGRNCRFGRNTLLERGNTRYIISTVGAYYPYTDDDEKNSGCVKINTQGYYETLIFEAMEEGVYWDINVEKQLPVPEECDWVVENLDFESDKRANDMHERIVTAVQAILENGESLGE